MNKDYVSLMFSEEFSGIRDWIISNLDDRIKLLNPQDSFHVHDYHMYDGKAVADATDYYTDNILEVSISLEDLLEEIDNPGFIILKAIAERKKELE